MVCSHFFQDILPYTDLRVVTSRVLAVLTGFDFSKAFDTVGRTEIWQLLKKCGCPKKFTTTIEALHTGTRANVSVGGEVSESFSVTNGVKQGC